MFEQTLAILRNTFFEAIRQPVMLVILCIATLALILSNPLAGFTMEDDQRMLIDIGLATVFLCGAILAAFVSASVLTREIDNKTALTVISKPVGRPVFVIGKFLGVAAALFVATLFMSLVFLLVELHGTLQTVRDPLHLPVITFGIGAAVIGIGVALWCNYFYGKVFGSTVIVVTTPLLLIAYIFALMFDAHFAPQPIGASFNPQFWYAITSMMMAVMVLTAIALAASTRLSQVMTLAATLGLFMIGMLSDWFIGRRIEAIRQVWLSRARDEGLTEQVERVRIISETMTGEREEFTETVEVATVGLTRFSDGLELLWFGLLNVLYALIPNFQTMILLDALTQYHEIPGSYVFTALLYGFCCMMIALGIAVILFQRREVG